MREEYKAIDEQLKNRLYNSKIAHDKKWIIDNFEAVLDKYIITLEGVYRFSGKITSANRICLDGVNFENNPQAVPILDVEWEEIDHWDKNPSTQTIAEGTVEVKLDTTNKKLLAWAYVREYLSGYDYRHYNISQKNLDEYKEMLIEELLERNDWEFLKEREVTGE